MADAVYFPSRADIRGQVRFFIDEAVQANFTDADLNYAINTAQQDVATEMSLVNEQYFVNTTPTVITQIPGQQYYDLPTDFWKMVRLEDLTTGLQIPFTDIDSQNNFFQTAIPPLVSITFAGFAAMIVGNKVGFTPIPTATQQAQFWYVPILPDLQSDTSTTQIPRQFTDLIAMKAAIYAMIKDEDDTTPLERQYAARFNQLVRATRDRQQQNPKKVRRIGDTTQYPGWTI